MVLSLVDTTEMKSKLLSCSAEQMNTCVVLLLCCKLVKLAESDAGPFGNESAEDDGMHDSEMDVSASDEEYPAPAESETEVGDDNSKFVCGVCAADSTKACQCCFVLSCAVTDSLLSGLDDKDSASEKTGNTSGSDDGKTLAEVARELDGRGEFLV